MFVLAIETTGPVGGVAVLSKGRIQAEETFDTQGKLGARLTPAVDKALSAVGVKAPDVIAVDIGPGSYTGTRVGLAAAKGLAFGWRCPVVPVPSLNALASQVPLEAGRVLVTIDARRGEVYAALFEAQADTGWTQVWSPGICSPLQVAKECAGASLTVVGSGAEFVAAVFPKNQEVTVLDESSAWPKAETIARLGRSLYGQGRLDDTLRLTPAYMRPTAPEVDQGRKRRRTTRSS